MKKIIFKQKTWIGLCLFGATLFTFGCNDPETKTGKDKQEEKPAVAQNPNLGCDSTGVINVKRISGPRDGEKQVYMVMKKEYMAMILKKTISQDATETYKLALKATLPANMVNKTKKGLEPAVKRLVKITLGNGKFIEQDSDVTPKGEGVFQTELTLKKDQAVKIKDHGIDEFAFIRVPKNPSPKEVNVVVVSFKPDATQKEAYQKAFEAVYNCK